MKQVINNLTILNLAENILTINILSEIQEIKNNFTLSFLGTKPNRNRKNNQFSSQ